MEKFSIEKKGYSIKEVDDYIIVSQIEQDRIVKEKQSRINELREENFTLTRKLEEYKSKEESISKTLLTATQKAQEIEKQAREEKKLQLKNLDDFYNKWEEFFKQLLIRYPKMEDFDTEKVLSHIKKDISNLLTDSYVVDKKEKRTSDPFQDLLKKLKSRRNISSPKKVVVTINKTPDLDKIEDSTNELEYISENNKINQIKPITNLNLENDEKDEFENLVDKFLHSKNNISKGYESSILNTRKKVVKPYPKPNESGFDLEEALNPTDDLGSIMKGFKLD